MFDYGADLAKPNHVFDENLELVRYPDSGTNTLLLDADCIPYVVGFRSDASEYSAYKSGYKLILHRKKQIAQGFINQAMKHSGCDSVQLFITGRDKPNFRYKVAMQKPYKGNRTAEKPPFFHEMRDWLHEFHGAVVSEYCEADDLVSIRANELGVGNYVIYSQDKDLSIVKGHHLSPKFTEVTEVTGIGELGKNKGTGVMFFYSQMLTGDVVDNYGGLKGYGKVKAFKLLSHCKDEQSMHDVVLGEYIKVYGDKPFTALDYEGFPYEATALSMMREQGQLAWMQTYEGEMWEPLCLRK